MHIKNFVLIQEKGELKSGEIRPRKKTLDSKLSQRKCNTDTFLDNGI